MFTLLLFLVSQTTGEYVEFELDEKMTIGWEISADRTSIDFTFKCDYGWCSLGIGHGMKDADMLVALYPDGGDPSYRDTWSEKDATPPRDTEQGGSDDLTMVSAVDTGNGFIMVLRRDIDTGDEYDKVIQIGESVEFSYAYRGGTGFKEHTKFEEGKITIAETQADSDVTIENDGLELHGTMMLIFWNIGATVAIIAARYFKWWAPWYWIHLVIFTLAIGVTILSAQSVYQHEGNAYVDMPDDTRHHSRLGLALTCIVLGQGIFGLLVRWYARISTDSVKVALVRRLHKILGWALYVIGMYNVLLGWHIYEDEWEVALPIIMIAILLLFELRHQLNFIMPKLTLRWWPYQNLSHKEVMEQIQQEKKQYVFFEEHVLHIKEFKWSHPGTAFVIKKAIGEDVGKYIFGCSSYGGDALPYNHSNQTLDMIPHLSIGRVAAPADFFLGVSEFARKESFKIVSKQTVAQDTFLITLTHDNFKINPNCVDPIWMGKHFRVTTSKAGVSRYYSSFFVDLADWGSELGALSTADRKPQGAVQLIIKVYRTGKLTSAISELNPNQDLVLSGPYGPGLCLSQLEGNFLAIVGGTGLVPILDLVHYMGSSSANCRLTVYASFASQSYAFCKDVLDAAQARLQGKLEIVWYFSDQGQGKPQKLIESLKERAPDLVWICGPSGFNRFAYNILREKPKIAKNKIVLM